MKSLLLSATCAMSLLTLLTLLPGGIAAAQAPPLAELDVVERSVPDGPVAMIDGRIVSRETYLKAYRDQLNIVKRVSGVSDVAVGDRVKMGLGVLGELLRWEVLQQEAERRGLSVTAREVDEAYQQQVVLLQEEMGRESGKAVSEAEVLSTLGKTREDAREEVQKGLLIEKAKEALAGNKPAVPEAELRKFYNENPQFFQRGGALRIKQLVVRPQSPGRTPTEEHWEAAQRRIEVALKRIHAGESFDNVARDVSDAADKIDTGMVPVEQMPPFYVDVAEQLKPGGTSNVFRTSYGLHMIQLVAREGGENMSFEQAAPRIREHLQDLQMERTVDDFCEAVLTDGARVRVYLQLEKTLAALPEAASAFSTQ